MSSRVADWDRPSGAAEKSSGQASCRPSFCVRERKAPEAKRIVAKTGKLLSGGSELRENVGRKEESILFSHRAEQVAKHEPGRAGQTRRRLGLHEPLYASAEAGYGPLC